MPEALSMKTILRWVLAFAAVGCMSPAKDFDPVDPLGPVAVQVTDAGWEPTIVAAGDIATNTTHAAETAALIDSVNPDFVLTMGDNTYDDGSIAQYAAYWQPTWGRFKAISRPAPGNHDHHTDLAGYCDFFGSDAVGCQNHESYPQAYYSYDIGAWHFIALDSGDVVNPLAAGTAERAWLTADLAAHAGTKCTAVYWHHPLYSSSGDGDNLGMRDVWLELLANHVDVVLNGHSHDYERFGPQDGNATLDVANGIPQFVVGTGGATLGGFAVIKPNSFARAEGVYGVLKLKLKATSLEFAFMAANNATFTDTGTIDCH
jgi:hypothetical protein